jgi:heterodisulfide reductase subunit A2
MMMKPENGSVVIAGGGIGGISAALSLAEMNIPVVLVEKSPAVGGILNQIDRQFPNDHCGICRMLPMVDRDAGSQFCVRRGVFHENITVMTSTRVVSVEGSPGDFTLSLNRLPEGIDPEKCTNCGDCFEVCPVSVPDAFNGNLTLRKAVYHPIPARVPASPVIDWQACTRCNACVDTCSEGAVCLESDGEDIRLEKVSGIIRATGTPLADPLEYDVYGYGVLPNVVTATAFERMVSGTGPFGGKAVRPSDGKPLHRLAWIQCVGSRNVTIDANYCSSACCMFAVKEAVLAREVFGHGTETTIFYMDMRTYGRDFQRYRDTAEREHGVKFVRCRVHSVEPGEADGDVRLCYTDESGKPVDAVFDLVVLSTGQKPGGLSEDPVFEKLTGDGIETVDSALGLKDIAATVISANRAVVKVGARKANATLPMTDGAGPAGVRAAFWERYRTSVVLCYDDEKKHPGVDWPGIETGIKKLPGNVAVAHCETGCSGDNWGAVKEIVSQNRANRLVLVTRNPYQLWPKISALYDTVSMLPSQVEVVDLRMPGDILKSIEMAVNRLRSRKPQSGVSVEVAQTAVVIGAGPAGLSAALALSDWGIRVVLVEKADAPGGNLKDIVDPDTRVMIQALVEKARGNPLIEIHCGATVASRSGSAGQFHTVIRGPQGEESLFENGAIIVATGGGPLDVDTYGYGSNEKITTQFEFEKQLADPRLLNDDMKTVVMIQCAGSREEPRNYCSRVCCLKALKNAIAVKERSPGTDVYVFYRDIMAYGDSERIYTTARKAGVLFIPFDPGEKPRVSVEGEGITVEAMDPILGEMLRLSPDRLVLSTGIKAHGTDDLQSILGFETTRDGFIQEADSKWRPVDTGKEGIFVCGLARNPVKAEEAMVEGEAAARRALRILLKKSITPQRTAARVRHAVCSRCEMCIEACMYGARVIDTENDRIIVDPASCQGCGTCAAVCPNSATVIGDFEDDGVMGAIEAAFD